MEARGLAPDKKNAADLGAHLVFIDESGFMLIPPVRKTWALRGRTPIHPCHQLHDRISIISALTASPVRKKLGLYFNLYLDNISQPDVLDFLHYLLRHLRGPVIVIWDNGSIHKGSLVREFLHQYPRLHLEALPPYAPELNPDEGVWAQTKNTLANGRPDDVGELWRHLYETLNDLAYAPACLRACIHNSDLPPFLG
jgi:transposase